MRKLLILIIQKLFKNSLWGLLLILITLIGCQNEPEYIEMPSEQTNGISFEYFDTQVQLKKFVNQIQNTTSKDLLGKTEQTVAFKVYENKEVFIHKEPNKTSYTVAIDKQDSDGSGFSNLVVEFEEDQVKTAFILNYAPTQEYLRNYLENPLSIFKGTVSLETIQGATDSNGLYARGVECQIIKMHLCNNLGEEHAAGVKCDPDHRYIKTHRICTNVPVILGQGQGIGNDSEFSPEGGGATGGGGSTTVGTGGVPTNPVTPDPCDTSDSLTLGLQSTSGECVKIVEAPEFLNLVLELNSDVQQYLNHFSNSSVREEFKKYLRDNNYSDEAKRIFKNSATIAKNLTFLESYWPESDEEWAVIIDLFKNIAGETLLGLIPGYDFVDAVKEITKGNYGSAALALGAGVLSFSPAITAKVIKVVVDLAVVFNKIFKFIKPLVKAFTKGFKTAFENGILYLKNRFGRIISKGDDVEAFANALSKLDNLPNAIKIIENGADPDLIKRINNLSTDQLNQLDNMILNQKKPGGYNNQFDFTSTKTINGQQVSVKYDKNGFPDFTPHISNPNHVFRAEDLIGSGNDFTRANNWAINEFGASNIRRVPNSTAIDIKDSSGNWIRNTWHHHQDGKTMFPIPSNIHNVTQGGFNHSGGKTIINRGLKGLFESPIFSLNIRI